MRATRTVGHHDPVRIVIELRAEFVDGQCVRGYPQRGCAADRNRVRLAAVRAELLGKLKNEKDRLPFPVPEPVIESKK